MEYPREFADLQPLARICHDRIGDDSDSLRYVEEMTSAELDQYVQLYVRLVDEEFKPKLDAWFDTQEISRPRSEVFCLLLFLDYLARNERIPKPYSSRRFIEWDRRKHDDAGNEW